MKGGWVGRPRSVTAPRKEITTRLEMDLYEQLREAAFQLRISQQQAMVEALEMWLSNRRPAKAAWFQSGDGEASQPL